MKLHGRSVAVLPRRLLFARLKGGHSLFQFHGRSDVLLPSKTFIRPASGTRLVGLSVFLHIFAETIKIFLQKRVIYVKILLGFFV